MIPNIQASTKIRVSTKGQRGDSAYEHWRRRPGNGARTLEEYDTEVEGHRAATAADRAATGSDRAATAADRVATGADRVQTGKDRVAAETARTQAQGFAPATHTIASLPNPDTVAQTTWIYLSDILRPDGGTGAHIWSDGLDWRYVHDNSRAWLAETNALLTRMMVPPTAARRNRINKLINALKATGVWQATSIFHMLAAHDAQAARLNWKDATFTLAEVNAPAFLADRHYQGDGVSSYLDPGVALNTVPNLSAVSANAAIWVRNNITTGASAIGTVGTANLRMSPRNSNVAQVRITSTTDFQQVLPALTSVGMLTANRLDSEEHLYKDGALFGARSGAGGGVNSSAIRYLHSQYGYSTHQLAFASLGGSLTAEQVAARYNAVQSFLQGIGAA